MIMANPEYLPSVNWVAVAAVPKCPSSKGPSFKMQMGMKPYMKAYPKLPVLLPKLTQPMATLTKLLGITDLTGKNVNFFS